MRGSYTFTRHSDDFYQIELNARDDHKGFSIKETWNLNLISPTAANFKATYTEQSSWGTKNGSKEGVVTFK